MSIVIKQKRILDYYDLPLLFTGEDKQGKPYLCMLVDDDADELKYLCVHVTELLLESFMRGKVDLHDIYTRPNIKYYLCGDQFVITPHEEEVPEDWLPGTGYFYQGTK